MSVPLLKRTPTRTRTTRWGALITIRTTGRQARRTSASSRMLCSARLRRNGGAAGCTLAIASNGPGLEGDLSLEAGTSVVRAQGRFCVNRTVVIVAGVTATCLIAGAVVVLIDRSESEPPHSAPAVTTSIPASANDPTAPAHDVATALNRLVADPDSLVASASRDEVGSRAGVAVPAGSTVEVDESSWAPDGAGGGVMMVTVSSPGQPPVVFATVMVLEAGGWKVLATVPTDGTG